MESIEGLPKWLISLGALLVVAGILLWLLDLKNPFAWFGHLPGDIRIERDNFRFYAPLVSMLVVSVVVSLLLRLWRHFF
jgi:ribose/xylose/arabinose/galactoside ABC-type transport system permease subunit